MNIVYNKTYRMKNLFLGTLFLLGITSAAHSQNWNTIRYKDLVSFELPVGYTIMDTAGTKIYQSEIDDTTYICTFVEDVEPIRFASEESISAFYTDFFDGLVAKSNKPKVLKKEIVSFGKFKALRASLERNVIVKELTWEILVFHVQNTTLSFQCITQKKAKAQFDRLEKSIRFNDALTEKDQIDPAVGQAAERGFFDKYGAYLLVGLAVMLGVGFLQRRKKKN